MKSTWSHGVLPAAIGSAIWAACAGSSFAAPTATSQNIKVDQFGYTLNSKKIAIIANPVQGSNARLFLGGTASNNYKVKRWADDVVVYQGTLQAWGAGALHAQSGDKGWSFDFSAVTTPGSYYIYDDTNKVGSFKFDIADSVYNEVLKRAVRTYFYQRLNQDKQLPYADAGFTDRPAYPQDTQARSYLKKNDATTARNLSGGWMDAGDTNKYTTSAGQAVLPLLEAYRINPSVFADNWGIPESGNGLPDLLDEVKYELDFLKRMQDASGTKGLFLKVGLDTYAGDVSPLSLDKRPRYYVGECTSSTIAGAAMFAAGSVVYKGIPSQLSYGNDLLARAQAAWNRAKTTTNSFTKFDLNCDDGSVLSGNADLDQQEQMSDAVSAAVYLYEATGLAEYKSFIDSKYKNTLLYEKALKAWFGPYSSRIETALLRYTTLPGATPAIVSAIKDDKKLSQPASLPEYDAKLDLYRAYMADGEYGWSSTKQHSNTGINNLNNIDFKITTDVNAINKYKEIADQHIHWIHGANPLSYSYLSNMGAYGAEKSVQKIYHAWFGNTPTAASGFLTSGPNKNYDGNNPAGKNQPIQKSYLDWNAPGGDFNGIIGPKSFEFSEPVIDQQAAYIQLLSRVMKPVTQPVYTDALAPYWSNWSFDAILNYSSTAPTPKAGAYSVGVSYTKGWGGASWHAPAPVQFTSSNAAVSFWTYSSKPTTIAVATYSTDASSESPKVIYNLPASSWTPIKVTRAQLGNPNSIQRVTIQNYTANPISINYDEVQITQ